MTNRTVPTTTTARAQWLTSGVKGIGAASLLADIGHEIPTALLPSLLTSTLGAPASALGAIEGISDALAGIARFGGGALADQPERRRTLAVGGYTATAVLSAAIAPVTATWQVAILRAGAWTARGLRVPARNALLADVVPADAYGHAYGFERAMDNLGAILGPLAAIGLVATIGIRWAIAVSVIPGLAATLAVIYAIRHTPKPTPQPKRALRFQIRPVLVGPLRRLFGGIAAFEFGNCAATLLILRATQLLQPDHGKNRATTIALALYVGYNIAATITSLIAGHHSDRTGPTRVLAIGVAAFAVAYTGFTHDTTNWAVLLPWFVLAGIGIGCVETAEHAAVATHTPAAIRGSAFGLLAATQSFGNLAASLTAGILWTAASPTWAFSYLAAAMVISLATLLTSDRTPAPDPAGS
jgi:MFS family permease